MRFGLVIDSLDAAAPLDGLIAQARVAEDAGFDLVWLPESDTVPAPVIAAAALAPHTSSVRVGVAVTAGVNPVYLAEEAAVADLCLGGRLVFAVGSDDAGLLAETVDVLLAASAARPFRHEGERWQIPANLPENEVNREDRVRITPATAQLELPIWVTGPHGAQVAREHGLTFVGEKATEALASEWRRTGELLGSAADRLRRAAIRSVAAGSDGAIDGEAVVAALRADYRAWGMDIALIALPTLTPQARVRAVDTFAGQVVPRVQLDRLPPGLEQYWKRRQEMVT